MEDYTTRVELMAIPIVAVIFGIGVALLVAGAEGPWAWLIVSIAGLVLLVLLAVLRARRHPHPAAETPAPAATRATADGTYRLLVIADESLIDPAFPAQVVAHASGREIEALVIAPTIGSWLSRWTGDESVHQDARRHLDDTVAALARAGITASGETGADDPLQAADDGLREFAANEIVFVTKPGTSTDWAEKGVVVAARDRYPVPVTHIALPEA